MYKIEVEEIVTTITKNIVEVTLAEYIAAQIKNIRNNTNLSQKEITELLDGKISLKQYSRLEQGLASYKVEHLEVLADIFNVHISDFFPKKQ